MGLLCLTGALRALSDAIWQAMKQVFWRRICGSVTLTNRMTAFDHLLPWLDAPQVLIHVWRVEVSADSVGIGVSTFFIGAGRVFVHACGSALPAAPKRKQTRDDRTGAKTGRNRDRGTVLWLDRDSRWMDQRRRPSGRSAQAGGSVGLCAAPVVLGQAEQRDPPTRFWPMMIGSSGSCRISSAVLLAKAGMPSAVCLGGVAICSSGRRALENRA